MLILVVIKRFSKAEYCDMVLLYAEFGLKVDKLQTFIGIVSLKTHSLLKKTLKLS